MGLECKKSVSLTRTENFYKFKIKTSIVRRYTIVITSSRNLEIFSPLMELVDI